jgi:uncharacterized protein (DUF488 family)
MRTTCIWTIGHSTRTADEFVSLLQAQQIDRLADIRTIPQSRRHPHFGREALAAGLTEQGVGYRHFKDLGGLRKPLPNSPNGAWQNASFRGYADHMQTPEFDAAVDDLLTYADGGRLVVMCAEAVWWRCHRMLLSDALVARGIDVQHIVSATSIQPHRLTPFSQRRDDSHVWYPGLV